MDRHTYLATTPNPAGSNAISHLILSASALACSVVFSSDLWPTNPAPALPPRRIANASPSELPVIYLSDFELDVVRHGLVRTPPPRNSSGTASGSVSPPSPTTSVPGNLPPASPDKPAPPPAKLQQEQMEDPAIVEANSLVNGMAENLVSAFQKAGYAVVRLRSGRQLPKEGLRIRGVFAEPDERNRVRRLVVGRDPTSPKMLLYVGVNNLARPEQPLYELANPPSSDGSHGPVITVTSYSPAARFELPRTPTDEEFKKVAMQIAADVTALLNANPLGIR
jgi:Domain of unknown function (DUF4410)